ncbi:MAG: UDP-N-acetylglucosamine--N-acetylmuramyl-(pentapeptide) pyrophosphoryl-undecaprenol N-acetylglucosamine transferase, partial [Candidatus Binatota bacterium]
MRLIMAGGGTGGHLFPGLAVAREFQKRDAMTEILFVGTEMGIESRVVPREGLPLATIPIRGMKGRGVRGFLQALYGIPKSFFRSLGIIGRYRPDCIIGLGGYASGPFLLAGKVKGIRCAIMEQNLRPGFTNRILARVVDRVFTSYEESASYFPGARVIETGNPVRWQTLPEIKKGEKFTLLVFGGSAGAHKINLCVLEALQSLRDLATGLRVIHQTGEVDFASIKAAYGSLPFEAEVLPFIDRMDEAYARADLVLCRS